MANQPYRVFLSATSLDLKSFRKAAAETSSRMRDGTGAGTGQGDQGSEEPAPKPSELKILDRLIGTWKDEATFKVSEGMPKERRETYIYRTEWTLNGRFVQNRGCSSDGDAEDLQVMTFDPVKKTFRRWYFDSDGNISELVPNHSRREMG